MVQGGFSILLYGVYGQKKREIETTSLFAIYYCVFQSFIPKVNTTSLFFILYLTGSTTT